MGQILTVSTPNPYLRADMEPFKLTLDWQGDADMAVSKAIAATLKASRSCAPFPNIIKGGIMKVETSPGANGDRTTCLPLGTYGLTLLDPHGLDVLDGNGAGRSASIAESVLFGSPSAFQVEEDLTLTITSVATTDQLAGDGAFASVANWTLGAGWSDGTGHVHKGAGTGTLTHAGGAAFAATAGRKYDVTFTISSWSAAVNRSLTVSCGGADGTPVTDDGTYTQTFTALTTDGLVFTPTGTDATNVAFAMDNVTVKYSDPKGRVIIFII